MVRGRPVALDVVRMRVNIVGRVREETFIEAPTRTRRACILPCLTRVFIKPYPTVGLARASSEIDAVPRTANDKESMAEAERLRFPCPVVTEESAPDVPEAVRVSDPLADAGNVSASVAEPDSEIEPVAVTGNARTVEAAPRREIEPVPVVAVPPVPVVAAPVRVMEPLPVEEKANASLACPDRDMEPVPVDANESASLACADKAIEPVAVTGNLRTSVAAPVRVREPVPVEAKDKESFAAPVKVIEPVAVTA